MAKRIEIMGRSVNVTALAVGASLLLVMLAAGVRGCHATEFELGAPILGGKYTDSAAILGTKRLGERWQVGIGLISSQTRPWDTPSKADTLAALRAAAYTTAGAAGFNGAVDASGDGAINAQDFIAVRQTSNTERTNAFAQIQLIESLGPVDFGLGVAYWQYQGAAFNSNTSFSLSVAWNLTERIALRLRHWSTGGSTEQNKGQDMLTVGYRFAP